MKYATMRRYIV